MIVVDSSAVIAIVFAEPEGAALLTRLDQDLPGQRVISEANYVESGAVLAGRIANRDEAKTDLDRFLALAGIEVVPVDVRQSGLALEARVRFGRGFGSGAKLNFGDCFAYALAKAMNAPLLYVGNDFTQTDIVPALSS